MQTLEIKAVKRDGFGKKAAKAYRREGLIPCIIYGGGEEVAFTVDTKSVKPLIYSPNSYVVEINIDGKIEKAAGLHEKLSPLFRNCFVESNPIPAKAALAAMGMMQNELRLPLVPSQQKTYDLMVETVKDLGLL